MPSKTAQSTRDHIKAIFDSNPNMTLAELSKITRLTVSQLKKILLDQV